MPSGLGQTYSTRHSDDELSAALAGCSIAELGATTKLALIQCWRQRLGQFVSEMKIRLDQVVAYRAAVERSIAPAPVANQDLRRAQLAFVAQLDSFLKQANSTLSTWQKLLSGWDKKIAMYRKIAADPDLQSPSGKEAMEELYGEFLSRIGIPAVDLALTSSAQFARASELVARGIADTAEGYRDAWIGWNQLLEGVAKERGPLSSLGAFFEDLFKKILIGVVAAGAVVGGVYLFVGWAKRAGRASPAAEMSDAADAVALYQGLRSPGPWR